MVSALCPITTSVPLPANTTATSCPTSNDPFAAMWRGIEAVVGSLVPVVTMYRNRIRLSFHRPWFVDPSLACRRGVCCVLRPEI